MSKPIIEVEGLSKHYRLGVFGYGSLQKDLVSKWAALRGRPDPNAPIGAESGAKNGDFWALREVSFSVMEGEALGVIGRNGAGKSTLLKILSRITAPTHGRVRLRGRVASMLEVGTGFHPELTGRENTYLNGAILGMSRSEIDRKFDEIVDFSGVESFIDTPVKRYSSGMYVRLAFAVAAHLEPEILLVDEVLAVGDAGFQKKCLGKMRDVAERGRTVLFVSHNINAIRMLCPKCLLLRGGELELYGDRMEIITRYLGLVTAGQSDVPPQRDFPEDESKSIQLLRSRLVNLRGELTRRFDCDEPVVVELFCRVRTAMAGLYGYFSVIDSMGSEILVSDSFDAESNSLDGAVPGDYTLRIVIPARSLAPGDYNIYLNFTVPIGIPGIKVDSPGMLDAFRLDDFVTHRGNTRHGSFSTRLAWNLERVGCPPT